MKLEDFTRERSDHGRRKYKTVNIDDDLHLFLKKTATYYNLPLADLMYHILVNWKDRYEGEIKDNMLKDLNK
ncbi:hypothetical protein [Reichenbachiella agariperforans]|uniref:hypothetical protein n=1 Tax=Reichenbachiella agariperforans TaxID=156994 RepID=UPI001C09210E|nr:hypothetical protein [Reichenbachiella agariperforans]MBU2914150.1 hypothetical protein [Reichenbachiella agariperforans]